MGFWFFRKGSIIRFDDNDVLCSWYCNYWNLLLGSKKKPVIFFILFNILRKKKLTVVPNVDPDFETNKMMTTKTLVKEN